MKSIKVKLCWFLHWILGFRVICFLWPSKVENFQLTACRSPGLDGAGSNYDESGTSWRFVLWKHMWMLKATPVVLGTLVFKTHPQYLVANSGIYTYIGWPSTTHFFRMFGPWESQGKYRHLGVRYKKDPPKLALFFSMLNICFFSGVWQLQPTTLFFQPGLKAFDCPRPEDQIWRWPKVILGRWGWRRWIPSPARDRLHSSTWDHFETTMINWYWSLSICDTCLKMIPCQSVRNPGLRFGV